MAFIFDALGIDGRKAGELKKDAVPCVNLPTRSHEKTSELVLHQ